VFGAAVLGLALAAALWWTYFAQDEGRAEAATAAAPLGDRLRMALSAYFYSYIPILLGVITLAAGLHLAIGDITARLDPAEALLLGGGVAIFLAGGVGFRLSLGLRPVVIRLVGAGLAMATVVLGMSTSALVQVLGLLAVLIALLWAEALIARPAIREAPG
jgi:low temperature requirement protein LtrA